MKPKQNKTILRATVWPLILMAVLLSACDDGKLNTMMTKERLSAYMEENENLYIYMHSIYNYRQPVYMCLYDLETGASLNEVPRGKFGTGEGIPYGEFTAVEIPEATGPEIDVERNIPFFLKKTGTGSCAPTTDSARENPDYILYDMLMIHEDSNVAFNISNGYLSESLGGESWGNICGTTGDQSCDTKSGIGMGGGALRPQPAPAGKTTLNFFSLVWQSRGLEMTLCWDPDGSGPQPSILLTEFPEPYREDGWPVFDPITTGTIHLQDGIVDCSTANLADAIATKSLPAQMTFGPTSSQIEFGPDTSGTILITGVHLDGVPSEAQLRIVPLLHW
jgi:hypothetical protein